MCYQEVGRGLGFEKGLSLLVFAASVYCVVLRRDWNQLVAQLSGKRLFVIYLLCDGARALCEGVARH